MIHTDTHIYTHTDTHLPTKQADPKNDNRDSWQSSRFFRCLFSDFLIFCIFRTHTNQQNRQTLRIIKIPDRILSFSIFQLALLLLVIFT